MLRTNTNTHNRLEPNSKIKQFQSNIIQHVENKHNHKEQAQMNQTVRSNNFKAKIYNMLRTNNHTKQAQKNQTIRSNDFQSNVIQHAKNKQSHKTGSEESNNKIKRFHSSYTTC